LFFKLGSTVQKLFDVEIRRPTPLLQKNNVKRGNFQLLKTFEPLNKFSKPNFFGICPTSARQDIIFYFFIILMHLNLIYTPFKTTFCSLIKFAAIFGQKRNNHWGGSLSTAKGITLISHASFWNIHERYSARVCCVYFCSQSNHSTAFIGVVYSRATFEMHTYNIFHLSWLQRIHRERDGISQSMLKKCSLK